MRCVLCHKPLRKPNRNQRYHKKCYTKYCKEKLRQGYHFKKSLWQRLSPKRQLDLMIKFSRRVLRDLDLRKRPKYICDFCGKEQNEPRLVLRDANIMKKDGSDIVLCRECLNNYASGEYQKIHINKFKKVKKNANNKTA